MGITMKSWKVGPPSKRVRIHDTLLEFDEPSFVEEAVKRRRPGAVGILSAWVYGRENELWWIEHDDGGVAPYWRSEFDILRVTGGKKKCDDSSELLEPGIGNSDEKQV